LVAELLIIFIYTAVVVDFPTIIDTSSTTFTRAGLKTMAGSPIVVLDIGASKVVCLIGEADTDSTVKILGMGISVCLGLRRSVIVDLPKVVDAIQEAVQEAERAAGLKVTGAYVGVAGKDITSCISHSAVAISGSGTPIDEEDVDRALAAAEQAAVPASATVLHRFIQSYVVDGSQVQNPLLLHGSKLEIETLSVITDSHAHITLQRAIEEAGISIAGFVLESIGTAAGVVSYDEREMGVALLDIGAGTSDLAVFHQGSLCCFEEIPFGGNDITNDISKVLNASPRIAEELKHQYGFVCTQDSPNDQLISFATTAGRSRSISCQELRAIIEARQQEILEFVGQTLERHQVRHQLAAGLILTGGGALLENLPILGEEVLGLPVRLGIPAGTVGTDQVQDPRFTTAVGLLNFVAHEHAQDPFAAHSSQSKGFIDRITRFLSFF